MQERPRCLIAGTSNTALQVGRALGRQGIEVHYLYSLGPGGASTGGPDDGYAGSSRRTLPRGARAVSASRYCRGLHAFDPSETGYPEAMEGIARELDSPVVLLTSDEFLGLHASNWDRLRGLGIRAPLPRRESLLDALDKLRTFGAARRHGVGVPETVALDGPPEGTGGLEFPVIIKPRISAGSFSKLGCKAFICINRKELDDAGEKAWREWGPTVMQEYVAGPATRLWKYNAVFDMDHQPLGEFCFQKVAQYPMDAGVACLSRSAHREDLAQTARQLMRGMEWAGPVNMEFKEDPRDGELKLMEINPRPYLGIGQPILLGVNLPLALYELALGRGIPLGDYPDNHYYANPLLLASLVRQALAEGRIAFCASTLRQLLHRQLSLDVWAFDDPAPFRVQAGDRARRLLGRARAGRHRVLEDRTSPAPGMRSPSEAGR